MVRYLAIAGDDPSVLAAVDQSRLEELGLSLVCSTPHVFVATEKDRDFAPLETGEGGFIGCVFMRSGVGRPLASIPPALSNAVVDTKGDHALGALWGSYLLIAYNTHRGEVTIARDPSGGIPVFSMKQGGLTIFGGRTDDILAFSNSDASVSADRLLHHLVWPDIPSTETCLDGIEELQPGNRIVLSSSASSQKRWWNPSAHFDNAGTGSFAETCDRLEDALELCIASWGRCFQSVTLSLSGGLDSSLIAAFLPRDVEREGFNLSGSDPDSDERDYARLVATATGMRLRELPYDPALVDMNAPTLAHWPRPIGRAHMQLHYRAMLGTGDVSRQSGHLSGLGGDQVFCYLQSALPVVDRLQAGLGAKAVMSVASDVAKLAGVTRAAVLFQAGRFLFRGRRPDRRSGVEQFLSPDAKRHAEDTGISHFLAMLGQGTLGQVYHEEMLARLIPYVHDTPDSAGPPMLAPLVSQPIMETCLSIPSWDWVQGGRNRSVARHVAARRLPAMVAARQSKGGPDVLSAQLCRRHRRLLAERLLEGRLAAAQSLDREAVERALTETSLMTTGRQREILMLFEAELWMEHWMTRAHGRASSSFA